MILSALPRFSPATFSDRFADRDATVVWLEVTPAEAAAPEFAGTFRAALRNALGFRPGCIFAGAFLIVGHGRELPPGAELVALTFTGGQRPPEPGA